MGKLALVTVFAAAAAAVSPADAVCNMCHLQYFHKAITSKEPGLTTASACQQYSESSCCTTETANLVGDEKLYGEDYQWDRCGPMSEACQQYFVDEYCFYECDSHAGKWRAEPNCSAHDDAVWVMSNAPIKASFFDGWYEACKEDLFCGEGYFDLPTCDIDQCKKMKDIYSSGKDLCDKMWGGAFKYEEDEKAAYTMRFNVGEKNPNDDVLPKMDYPPHCEGSKHDTLSFNNIEDCIAEEMTLIDELKSKLDEKADDTTETIALAGVAVGVIGLFFGILALAVACAAKGNKAPQKGFSENNGL